MTVARMTSEFFAGMGPTYQTYNDDAITDALKNAPGVIKAKAFFYKKYKNAKDLTNASVTNYVGTFGIAGAYDAGLNPVRQFVGGYNVSIYSDGNILTFLLRNETSFKSLFFDVGPSWSRSFFGPMGTTYQLYIWTEPIQRP